MGGIEQCTSRLLYNPSAPGLIPCILKIVYSGNFYIADMYQFQLFEQWAVARGRFIKTKIATLFGILES